MGSGWLEVGEWMAKGKVGGGWLKGGGCQGWGWRRDQWKEKPAGGKER